MWPSRSSLRPRAFAGRAAGLLLTAAVVLTAGAGCRGSNPVLTRLIEARRLAAELHVAFTKSSEASSRAVMASSDAAATAAADDAKRARQDAERRLGALQPVLESLGYQTDLRHLSEFKTRFEEYRLLDDEILGLAVENSNVKAQRLSFGPAREAAGAFTAALDAVVGSGAKDRCRTEVLAARAKGAVQQIQVLQAPHIAETEDSVMTRLEGEMQAAETVARKAQEELEDVADPAAGPELAAAAAALDSFMARNQEIVVLSRRNSNVRSLALSLGRKRTVSAQCEDQLKALEEALAEHRFNATR
jgi:hypothetical protein